MNLRSVTGAFLGAAMVIGLGAHSASALSLYDNHNAKLDFSFEAGLAAFAAREANFGTGQDFDADTDDKNVDWQEFYMLPKLSGSFGIGGSSLYSDLAYTATGTRGDGDAIAYTSGDANDIRVEIATLGWKSGTLLNALGEDAIDFYLGKGRFVVSDGFVVGDGSFDQGEMGCFWLAPHSSFRRVGALKFNTQPVRGDIFYISTDGTQANTRGYGVNVEWTIAEKYGTVGAMGMKLIDSDMDTRDGMMVYEMRYMGNPFARFFDKFYLNVEVSKEINNNAYTVTEVLNPGTEEETTVTTDVDFDALAYAIEMGYTLPWWETTLSVRYARYSGDKASTEDKDEGYDSLFQKAFGRGWGTWLEGEIMGEYFYSNSNKKTVTTAIKLNPLDSLSTGVIFYHMDSDQHNLWGEYKSNIHLADELNIYVDWTVNDNLFLSFAAGRAWPGKGLKQLGYDEKSDIFEVSTVITF